MSYDSMASAASMLGLLFFLLLFGGVVVWALWPKNKKRFDQAARIPLEEPELASRDRKNQTP